MSDKNKTAEMLISTTRSTRQSTAGKPEATSKPTKKKTPAAKKKVTKKKATKKVAPSKTASKKAAAKKSTTTTATTAFTHGKRVWPD